MIAVLSVSMFGILLAVSAILFGLLRMIGGQK
jgi:hypothetical protein